MIKTLNEIQNNFTELMAYAEFLEYGDIHFKFDKSSHLQAIVSINSTKLGPAIGGCRLLSYKSVGAALHDCLRLGFMMTYKAAISNLDLGGGKAVIIKPPGVIDKKSLFAAFGRMVDELGGRYITAIDSGTSPDDMDIIATQTPHVTCTNTMGDPSPITAMGVFRGIEAAVFHRFKHKDLKGMRVAIQGAGKVAFHLAKLLHEKEAIITMTDINPAVLEESVHAFHVNSVLPDEIYTTPCDVFSPCALGSILNPETIPKLKGKIIAGSANNQLASRKYAPLFEENDILYAPDFVINAGGLIQVATLYEGKDEQYSITKTNQIYDTLLEIFTQAMKKKIPTNLIAMQIAKERIK